ncbi:hypothetical protein [Achromobacter sp. Marseille-Q4954]|uniref:hypothetical protein n=1 Tax=Achromobacter sp. Marseille-Q4954 TaxID=2942203 RepID=UPI0020739B27|nr:hypothetical protein [Achromobacter sp. Marseille-Q4954]
MEFSMGFVNQLMEFSFLRNARNSAVEDWGEDVPVTVLFSILGKGIAENFAQLSSSSRSRIFHLIEEGMNSPDDELSTAVATGLLEALDNSISGNLEIKKNVYLELGPRSKKYLLDLSVWHGSGK